MEKDAEELTVLISVDGSSQAAYAFHFYLANFYKSNTRLILMHVAEPNIPMQGTSLEAGSSGELWNQLLGEDAEKIKYLEEHYTGMLKNLKIEGRFEVVLATKPAELVCKRALEEKCCLVVVGSRGLGRVRRTILGSFSEFVANHAHCPVLICRQEGEGTSNVCGPM